MENNGGDVKRAEKWNSGLKRLHRLLGSNKGFYSLALHSFVEDYINTVCGRLSE